MFRKFFRKNRHVRSLSKESIEPEEIFFDSYFASQESGYENEKKIEVPVTQWALNGARLFILGIPVFLLGYVLFLYVAHGEEYRLIAEQNIEESVPIRAARGEIYDVRGRIIATNTSIFDIEFRSPDFMGTNEDMIHIASNFAKVSGESVKVIFEKMQNAIDRNFARMVLVSRITETEVAMLQDVLTDVPYLVLREGPARIYPYGASTAHITGYTGRIDDGDSIGKNGLELSYNDELSGTDGSVATFVNSQGEILGEKIVKDAKQGLALHTTIDIDLQTIAFEELNSKLSDLNVRGGSIIAIDPRNGEIRALISLPSFDPNIFRTPVSNEVFNELIFDPKKPFFNRVIRGTYPTGSVIKPMIASAALESGVIDPLTIIRTRGSLTVPSKFDPNVSYTFLDWKNHGNVDIRKAIAVSSNVYFYIIGGGYKDVEGLGIDRIKEYLQFFGWGEKLGIDLWGEADGLIPDPDWKAIVKNEEWYIGDTYNVSIGQGDILATPLQVAVGISAIANNGTIYTPHIVSRVEESSVEIEEKIVPISEETLKIVQEGMRKAVIEGSSTLLRGLPVKVAGKTGTAETGTASSHAWFAGFLPYENPELVLVVMIEDGEKSTEAVRVARSILNRYYGQ